METGKLNQSIIKEAETGACTIGRYRPEYKDEKYRPEPEKTELTLQEVAAKFGVPVEQLRIKE